MANRRTHLDAGPFVDLDELVDTAQRRLSLAGDQVGADAKGVDGVALLVERVQRVLVDVVAGCDLRFGQLRQLEADQQMEGEEGRGRGGE